MLSVSFIRDQRDYLIERLKIKNFHQVEIIDAIIIRDNERRSLQVKQDHLQAELNVKSREIGALYKEGKKEAADEAKEATARLKEEIKVLQLAQHEAISKLQELLVQVPNIPHISVPQGKGEADNEKVRDGGKLPVLEAGAVPHWDLISHYDIIDFELGNKLTGAGFPVYKGNGAKLQRALINFFLDENIASGYKEVLPPLMVNEDSGFGTGQLPDKEGQMYHIPSDDYYLIPTAEVPVTNIFRDQILRAKDLPVKYTAYTPCFRREAGSWGKDVRGLNRLHQFDKVEIVQIVHPDHSYRALEEMASHIEGLIVKLGLPYRIMRLCGGDISFTSSLTYDFEVYAAAQGKWLEVSSVSNFESYQANRLKLRFKNEGDRKTQLAHTLNGSALALPRIVAAMLENNQTPDGIIIPEILHPYTGFDLISNPIP
ncbi:MAG: seryl-tRNA synthetase [Bacteroides sp. SM23_62]|nr:MAG: seryl-tRNA synthetase [Bacteroides sp. SM23_62]